MNQNLNDDEVKKMKVEAEIEIKDSLKVLNEDFPEVMQGVGALLGAGAGGAGSLIALTYIGTTGLSAAGITSGLAAAGSIVGGGMAAGIFVLAVPVFVFGVIGYAIASRRKNARLVVALEQAIEKLYSIQSRLIQNAEYFKDEISSIKALIEVLKTRKPT